TIGVGGCAKTIMSEEHLNRNLRHLGDRLRYFRQQREFTLRVLAERADVSASLLSQIENGKANPSMVTLHNIASALDIPLASFFASAKDTLFPSLPNANPRHALSPGEARAELGFPPSEPPSTETVPQDGLIVDNTDIVSK